MKVNTEFRGEDGEYADDAPTERVSTVVVTRGGETMVNVAALRKWIEDVCREPDWIGLGYGRDYLAERIRQRLAEHGA